MLSTETAAEPSPGASAPQAPQLMAPPLLELRDSFASTALADILDRSVHASAARFTGGLSPAAGAAAMLDWASHLAFSPGKQLQLVHKAIKKAQRWGHYAAVAAWQGEHAACCIEPLPQDRRFSHPAWRAWPYNLIHQGFLMHQQWWHNATTGVRGVRPQHEAAVAFAARQGLDMFSPSNFVFSNPEVAERTVREGGLNLWRGLQHLWEDQDRALSGRPPVGAEAFVPGRDVACTPGQVVLRTPLMELIRYDSTTPQVHPEPVLLVPAWIMKFYILDLSPERSLVRHLLAQGFEVWVISWKNPLPADRDLGLNEYRLALMAALSWLYPEGSGVQRPGVHAVGYCLGGTLLALAAAAMAREGDDRLKSLTLLAAQTDFSEAGELMLFINPSQLSYLEDMMWEQGLLDAKQMAGAFSLLRSNDLVWSRMIRHYLLGQREPMSDLMAWNADATRMPYRMHSEYLRQLFLNNELAAGRYEVAGRPVSLADIEVPLFVVATEWDHVAPWRSVHKLHQLTHAELTFCLASGGHNAGIVSEPGRSGRSHRLAGTRPAQGIPGANPRGSHAHEASPEAWLAASRSLPGSWWLPWFEWLHQRSGPLQPARTQAWPGAALGSDGLPLPRAPGAYVFQA